MENYNSTQHGKGRAAHTDHSIDKAQTLKLIRKAFKEVDALSSQQISNLGWRKETLNLQGRQSRVSQVCIPQMCESVKTFDGKLLIWAFHSMQIHLKKQIYLKQGLREDNTM